MGNHILTNPVTTEELCQMTATVIHEIQTILGAISLNANLTAPEAAPGQQSTQPQLNSCHPSSTIHLTGPIPGAGSVPTLHAVPDNLNNSPAHLGSLASHTVATM